MDEPTSRTGQSSRRMASAKSTSTTRRSSSSRSSRKKGEPEVSPARWAGVAFVITAIVAAIILAMVSPSDRSPSAPGSVAEASAAPSPTALDVPPPAAKPTIIVPFDGKTTTEFIIPVTVELPKEDLPKNTLSLLIMRGEELLKRKDGPKNPATVIVEGVEIAEGQNELTAVLSGDGGPGPPSEPVVVTLDADAPDLGILEPEDKRETFEKTIRIVGTSQVGAKVKVVNLTNKAEKPYGTVGTSGEFEVSIPLKRGVTNKIEASAVDEAGILNTDRVRVTRVDGRPKVKVKAPETIDRSELPTSLRIVVDVTDAKDKPMVDAEVYFTLGGPGYTTEDETIPTDADGRAVWKPTVGTSSSNTKALELTVEVTSSLSEDTSKPRTYKIEFK